MGRDWRGDCTANICSSNGLNMINHGNYTGHSFQTQPNGFEEFGGTIRNSVGQGGFKLRITKQNPEAMVFSIHESLRSLSDS